MQVGLNEFETLLSISFALNLAVLAYEKFVGGPYKRAQDSANGNLEKLKDMEKWYTSHSQTDEAMLRSITNSRTKAGENLADVKELIRKRGLLLRWLWRANFLAAATSLISLFLIANCEPQSCYEEAAFLYNTIMGVLIALPLAVTALEFPSAALIKITRSVNGQRGGLSVLRHKLSVIGYPDEKEW